MGKALVGTRSGSGEGIATETAALSLAHENAIRDAIEASRAPATVRVYASAWRRFAAWCEAQGYPSLPAAPETVAAYLAERADGGRAPASIRLDRAAIRAAHRDISLPSPTEHPGVANVTRGLTRATAAGGRTPRRGPSGRLESKAAARQRGNVDIALASTMRDGLLRRSEAAALTWGDVELRADGTGRLLIRRSKTDQEGEGAVQYLGKDAAAALRRVRPAHVPAASPEWPRPPGSPVRSRVTPAG